MGIRSFFKEPSDVYVSFDTEGAYRRDAEPFVAFDTDVPHVKPLWAKESEFEIYERAISEINYEELAAECKAELAVEFKLEELKTLLLPAGEPVKLLSAGKQPLLLAEPERSEQIILEVPESQSENEPVLVRNLEAQHIIYFSDVEFKDGTETVVEDKITREKHGNFFGAKIVGVLLMLIMGAITLFPPISLNAAKISIDVNPTNTTPGLSFSINNNSMTVTDGKANLPIQTQPNQLVTSTLDLDVATTGADGYKMYVTTSGTDKVGDYTNALVNKDIAGADGKGVKIQSLASDITETAFPAGRWGYTTDSNFQSSTIFKPFPTYDATDATKHGGVEIASANTAIADSDSAGETPFTIGIKADGALPAGDYTNDLLFTVIVNPVTVTYNLNFDGNTNDSSLANVPATVTEASADVFRDITIPAGEPTRDDFIFIGWAESANGQVVYNPGDDVTMQVTNINDSQTVNKTLYAVWEQKEWLQDFDEENELSNVGDSKMLYDKRDGETYTVKRLPDGNVWMTQNLRYETGALMVSSNTEYGGYYDWNTALNICPSGWHLPSSSEQTTLDIAYGFSGESRTGVQADIAKYMSTDGNWPGFTTAGYYDTRATSAEVRNDGTHYAYWSRTADSNTGRENYAWYTTGNMDDFWPAYSNEKKLGFSVRCMAGEEKKKYLQEFNDAIDLRTVGNSDTYYDKRDGTAYTVKRLPDGKVWMTQNLAYTTGAYRVSDNAEYGAYYTWSVAQNVCPAGWHLPSGGSSGEYATLDRAYGYSGSNRTDAQAIQNYQLTTGNWPGMVLSGQYLNGTDYTGDRVLHWTSTASDSSNAYSFHFNTQSSKPMYPVYPYPKTAAATVRCVGDQPNVFFIQDFDENTMLPHTGDSATLTDRRDQSTYTVKRLPDGKVWMTQNLRYMGTNSDPGTTSVTSGSFTTAMESEKADVPISVGLSQIYSTSQTGAYYAGNTAYGAYYDWTAAHAVCPRGWHLTTVAESVALDKAYGYTGTNRDSRSGGGHGSTYYPLSTMQAQATNYRSTSGNWPGITLNGQVFQGSLTNVGGVSLLWLADGNGSSSNAFFHINVSSSSIALIYPNYNDMLISTYGDIGAGVRCVADEDAKVLFDANGGTGTMAMQSFTKGIRQNISANTFTRPGYTFMGWALTSNATTAKYTDGQPAVFNKATTLYAVWKANYMQEFDAKSQLPNAGDSAILMDSRDGSTYTVRRLEDGKVWMTQNLRYTGATDPGTSTRYSGSFTVNASDSQGSGTITLTNNFGSNYSSSAFAAYRGDLEDGAYYGWTAASKVCPKGWHLMTGNEIVNLNSVYGGTNAAVANAPSYGDMTSGSKAGFTLSGRYAGADFNYDSVKARYWTMTDVTGSNGSKAYSLAVDKDLNNTVEPISPNGWKYYGFTVRCVANEQETVSFDANGGSGTMADVTVEKGESVTLTNGFTNPAYNFLGWATSATGAAVYTDGQVITANEDVTLYALWSPKGDFMQDFDQDTELLTIGATKTLYDERDGSTYTVKRLVDGKVWMTKNLAYADGAYRVSSNADYGGYYDWTTAKTVCPSGWHLPTGGANGDFVTLDKAYGGSGANRTDSTMATNLKSTSGNWPGLVTAGYYMGSSLNSSPGIYWSSTEYTTISGNAYNMLIDSRVNPQDYGNSSNLYVSVRCIADYDTATITFNANGGSGTAPSPITNVVGQNITLPTNTLTRQYHNFLGWSTDPSATTAEYADGETITATEDMQLYAVWYDYIAFTASNGVKWTKALGATSFSNASSLCPAGFHVPSSNEIVTLVGSNTWVTGSMVTNLYNAWGRPHMIWASDSYPYNGARAYYDFYFESSTRATLTATSNPAGPGTVVCIK